MVQAASYLGFQGRQVCLRSDLAEAHEALQCRFPTLLQESAGDPAGVVEVRARNGEFALLSGEAEIFADRHLVNVLEQMNRVLSQVFIAKQPHLLWFHAAAVANDAGALVMPGSWGHGKSTLSAAFAAQGWTYLSDDLVPLDCSSGAVLPFPSMPAVRRPPPPDMERDRLSELAKDIVTVPRDSVADSAQSLTTLVFPTFNKEGKNDITLCTPASAVVGLLRNCLNLSVHGGEAVRVLCDLLAPISFHHLSYNDPAVACEMLAQLHGKGSGGHG